MDRKQKKEQEAQDSAEMTKALRVWAMRNNIRPVDFEDRMGWSYNHAWRILSEKDPFTPSAWGKFMYEYGIESLKEVARIAKVSLNGREV